MHGIRDRRRLAVMVAAVVMAAACGNASTSPGATAPSSGAPARGAPESVIEAFLAFARSLDQTFSVAISGGFAIGDHLISYEMTGVRSGGDVVQSGTQTIDGSKAAAGSAFVGGRLYGLGAESWTLVQASDAVTSMFASGLLSFDRALVLEDLGRDERAGAYRLRVTAGFSLFPPHMTTDAIPDAHDATERLELLVSDAGLPVEAVYSRSLAGTIDGTASTASGSIRFLFSDVGADVELPRLALVEGATMPPPVRPSPAAAETGWELVPLTGVPYAIEVPGAPSITTDVIDNPTLGSLPRTVVRVSAPGGTEFTAFEVAPPPDYIRRRGAAAVAAEVVSGEAANLGAVVLGQRPLEGSDVVGLDAILAKGTRVYRIRVYVFDDDTLELGLAGDLDAVASADADRFLLSLAPRD